MMRFLNMCFAVLCLSLIITICFITFSRDGQRYFEEQMQRDAQNDCINLGHVVTCDPPDMPLSVNPDLYKNRMYGDNNVALRKFLDERKKHDPTVAMSSELVSAQSGEERGIDGVWWTLHVGLPIGGMIVFGLIMFIIHSTRHAPLPTSVPKDIQEEARRWTPAKMRQRILALESTLTERDTEFARLREENDGLRADLTEKEEMLRRYEKANNAWQQKYGHFEQESPHVHAAE